MNNHRPSIEQPNFSFYPNFIPYGSSRNGAKDISVAEEAVASWEPTLERAIRAIFSIKASHVRAFDTETAGSYTATGFLVDAKNGIILSNRHVVSPAPIVAQGILCNYEEVTLEPIYRDPVHDFGFLRFDPSKVRFMELEEIPLSPARAKVGLEIRVVGNDAGEKLSILAGTLARLDRRAPEYGLGEYTDFNTFYLQAASGTSGGSSGSPVLDIHGHAVALNAGGATRASSSYYLPLDRVKRALEYVRRGDIVPRGTLQSEFVHTPYDELRRLGLPAVMEALVRRDRPDEVGLLQVEQVLPQGPADGILEEGDIILRMGGKMVTRFVEVFEWVDDNVGKTIELEVCRGGRLVDVGVPIQDLHAITPSRFVEVGGGVVHDLSYQLAKSYSRPVGGVYVATSGHMLGSASAWRGSVIMAVNFTLTPTLDAFVDAVKALPDGARVPVRFYSLRKAYKERVMIMQVDRHWHEFKLAIRNDKTGYWDYQDLPAPPKLLSYKPGTAIFPKNGRKPASILQGSFCSIDFHIPYLIDGMEKTQFYGTGLIIDKERGLVVCDRDTIPIAVGDIYLTFANSIVIPGKLVWLDPAYNFAVCRYDPALLGDTAVAAARFVERQMEVGEQVYLVGLGTEYSVVMRKTRVSSVGAIGTKECSPPRWRAVNVEGIKVEDAITTQGGVLCDEEGAVAALWVNYSSQTEKGENISFMAGLSYSLLRPVLEVLCRGETPEVRGLMGVELWTMRLSAARALGIPEEWTLRMEGMEGSKHTFLYVLNVLWTGRALADVLRVGDVILEVCGKMVTSLADLSIIQSAKEAPMKIWRNGEELSVMAPTTLLAGKDRTRVVGWGGALLQEPYSAVLEQVREVPNGVYISCTLYGSPANAYNLRPGVWVTEVDGHRVEGLDDFMELIKEKERQDKLRGGEEEGYVRVATQARNGATAMMSLRVDDWYWGGWLLEADEETMSGWKCQSI